MIERLKQASESLPNFGACFFSAYMNTFLKILNATLSAFQKLVSRPFQHFVDKQYRYRQNIVSAKNLAPVSWNLVPVFITSKTSHASIDLAPVSWILEPAYTLIFDN